MSDSEEKSKKRKTEVESSDTTSGKVESNATSASSFQLSKMRKVTVDEFKGNVLVNIREYYEDKASGTEKAYSSYYC